LNQLLCKMIHSFEVL